MTVVKSRREMYAEATQTAILEEATALFAERGYSATSLEDVASAAQVTRGAVYHHFAGKQALFIAVLEDQERHVIEQIAAVMLRHEDLWEGAIAAIDEFVDLCLDPTYSKLVWREGMAALGWQGLKECEEKFALGLIQRSVEAMVDAGYFERRAVDTTIRFVFHMFGAAGMMLAEAGPDDKQRMRDECAEIMKRMFNGLRVR